MLKITLFLAIAGALAFAGPSAAQSPARAPVAALSAGPDSLTLARALVRWMYLGNADSLWAHTSANMKKNMGSPESFRELTSDLVGNVGNETEVQSERFVISQGKPQYWRVARFNLLGEDLLVRLVIVNGELAGMGFSEAWDAPPVDKPK